MQEDVITYKIFLAKQCAKCLSYSVVLFLATVITQQVQAQTNYSLSGRIIDSIQNTPVINCSVYINGSSKGATTDKEGKFMLSNLPSGNYELIVSAIGFKTAAIPVSSQNYPQNLVIKLAEQSVQLSEVTVQPFQKDGWEKWGNLFLENFIGDIPNANECRLLNHEVLRFWFSEKANKLQVRAEEPLIIENKALGYVVRFQLSEFTINFNNQLLVYNGYPFFQEMTAASDEKKKLWKKNREEVYYGSLLHFMRCVYKGDWDEQGFYLAGYSKKINTEKLRIKTLAVEAAVSKDSAKYYKRVLKQEDTLTQLVNLSSLDSLLTLDNDQTMRFYFENKLEVLYKRYPKSDGIQSAIYLVNHQPIHIMQSGVYTSPRELITLLHWQKAEKIANMLPFDYYP